MMNLIRIVIFVLMGSLVGCADGSIEPSLIERRSKMSESIEWFFAIGLPSLERDPSYSIDKKLAELDVSLGADVITAGEVRKSMLYIHSYFMTASLVCYAREYYDNKLYEYWVLKIGSRRSDIETSVDFLLTVSGGRGEPRKVLTKSSHFKEKFELPFGKDLVFPVNNKTLSLLMPWLDKELYYGTSLEKYAEK